MMLNDSPTIYYVTHNGAQWVTEYNKTPHPSAKDALRHLKDKGVPLMHICLMLPPSWPYSTMGGRC
jgi:hypothetical protein